MDNKKLLISVLFIVIIASLTYADIQTQFTNGLTIENLTFTNVSRNRTRSIDLPLFINVSSAAFKIKGFNISTACIQAFANVSTVCGGLGTGGYTNSGAVFQVGGGSHFQNTHDNNVATFGVAQVGGLAILNINFTTPSHATKANLTVFLGGGTADKTIHSLDECFNTTRIQIKITSSQIRGNSEAFCKNATDETDLILLTNNTLGQRVYDEWITWDKGLGIAPTNVSVHMGFSDGDPQFSSPTSFFNLNTINFTPKLNSIMDNKCNCTSCNLTGITCRIPIRFNSSTDGRLEVSDISINYSNILDLNNCSRGGSVQSINFTIRDEDTNVLIDSTFTSSFNFSVNSTQATHTDNRIGFNNFSVCIFPNWGFSTGNYVIFYEATGYPQRRFLETTATYNNITQAKTLLLLNISEGINIIFRVTDPFSNPLNDVQISMATIINGVLTVVEQQVTDDAGLATFFSDPDKDHIFTFTKVGFQTRIFNLRPTTSEIITITMTQQVNETGIPFATGVIFRFRPSNGSLNNDTEIDFNFNITSTFRPITRCSFSLKNGSATIATNTSSFSTTNCFINIAQNTGNFSTITAEAIYELNNSKNITKTRQYKIRDLTRGQFSLKVFVDDIKAFSGSGFNDFTRMIMALVVIVLVMIWLSVEERIVTDVESKVMVIVALVWLFSYLGFFTLNYAPIPDIAGLKQYIMFYLILLGGLSYIIPRHL